MFHVRTDRATFITYEPKPSGTCGNPGPRLVNSERVRIAGGDGHAFLEIHLARKAKIESIGAAVHAN